MPIEIPRKPVVPPGPHARSVTLPIANILRSARTLIELKQWEKALELLEQIPRGDYVGSQYDQAYLMLAYIYFRTRPNYQAMGLDRLRCVIKTCLRLIEILPNDRRVGLAYFNLALLKFAKHTFDDARGLFVKASSLGGEMTTKYRDAIDSGRREALEYLLGQLRPLTEKLASISLGKTIWGPSAQAPADQSPEERLRGLQSYLIGQVERDDFAAAVNLLNVARQEGLSDLALLMPVIDFFCRQNKPESAEKLFVFARENISRDLFVVIVEQIFPSEHDEAEPLYKDLRGRTFEHLRYLIND
ncbi:MAG: hypothetical protein ABIE84_04160 [bacterium]